MKEELNPIIVGVGQYKQGKDTKSPLDPLNLIIRASKKAINDIAINEINNFIDHIYMVNINSWSYADAPTELCQTLGINPKNKIYMADGGNTPQMLVNRGAKHIAKQKASLILICGGEASYSLYQSKRAYV
jgi:acetyl-CoA acetyltransferase